LTNSVRLLNDCNCANRYAYEIGLGSPRISTILEIFANLIETDVVLPRSVEQFLESLCEPRD